MKLRIGEYLDKEIKKKGVSKKELYDKLKDNFYPNKDYVKYKGFTSKFYRKLYAEDIMEISYILDIDLNKMRDDLFNNHKKDNSLKVESALSKSKYVEYSENQFSKWSCVENNFVYIVWFRHMSVDLLDIRVEMYNIKSDIMSDISYLTHLAILKTDKDWKNKTFDEKMHSIKNLNKHFHENIYMCK